MSKLQDKIKELQVFCDKCRLDLNIKYYSGKEVCFKGINDKDDEVFNVSIWYPKKSERKFYIELNSQLEEYRGGMFEKEEILLLLSIDDLTDDELGVSPEYLEELENE